MIKLSVIVPVYNTENFISKCLNSILQCARDEFEVIVVNDGSPDNSIQLVKETFCDDRLRIIEQKNLGLSTARNTGVEYANGEYILHLDSDDFLDKQAIDLILNTLDKNTDLDVIIFNTKLVNDSGVTIIDWNDSNIKPNEHCSSFDYLYEYFVGNGCPAIWNKVFRRSLYIDFQIRHPAAISYGEDGSTVPRLIANAKNILKLDVSLHNYVQHKSSMMKQTNVKLKCEHYLLAFDIVDNYMINSGFSEYKNLRFRFKLWYFYSILNRYSTREIFIDEYLSSLYAEYIAEVHESNISLVDLIHINGLMNRMNYIAVIATKYNSYIGGLLNDINLKISKWLSKS